MTAQEPAADASEPVQISEATEVTIELVEAFARLIPQLSKSNPPPSEEELKAIVTSRASVLLIARDPAQGGAIVGSLTLVLFEKSAKAATGDTSRKKDDAAQRKIHT